MNVFTAESGAEAIDVLGEHEDIDVVLMDIMMPEMDGYETIRRIRAKNQWRSLPIIALTAKAMKGDRESCLAAGASEYISKPVDIDQLIALVRVWLNVSRLIAEDRPRGDERTSPAVTDLELQLLLEAVQRISGHDFREYAPAMLRRRVLERVRSEGAATISGLQERVLHEPGSMERFVDALTFNPSAPFADPAFFAEFLDARAAAAAHVSARARLDRRLRRRRRRLRARDRCAKKRASSTASASTRPMLRRRPSSARAPEPSRARDLDEIQAALRALGRHGAASRTTSKPTVSSCAMRESLREHIVFAQHNLATDGSFNEFHLDRRAPRRSRKFNRVLVYHAHQVIYESLVRLGFLALGAKESLRFTPHQKAYDAVPQTRGFLPPHPLIAVACPGGCITIFVEGCVLMARTLETLDLGTPVFCGENRVGDVRGLYAEGSARVPSNGSSSTG